MITRRTVLRSASRTTGNTAHCDAARLTVRQQFNRPVDPSHRVALLPRLPGRRVARGEEGEIATRNAVLPAAFQVRGDAPESTVEAGARATSGRSVASGARRRPGRPGMGAGAPALVGRAVSRLDQ